MLDRIKNIKYTPTKRVSVLGVHFTSKEPVYNLLRIKKVGDEISIEEELNNTTLDEVSKKVSKMNPSLVAFSGKGILSKKVPNKGNYLKEIIFSASPDDFYVYEAQEAQFNFVSVARKELLNEEFSKLNELGFQVVDYAVGPFVAVHINEMLNETSVCVQDYELSFIDTSLDSFSKYSETQVFNLGDSTIESKNLTLLSLAFQYLFPSEKLLYNDEHLLEERKTFKFKKLFNTAGAAMLAFFLAALLISYLAQNYYANKAAEHSAQLSNLNETYLKVKSLKSERDKKQAVLNESGILNSSFLSLYLNDIGNSVPKTINLISLELNPLGNRFKQDEKLEFSVNQVVVSGETKSSAMLNYWIKELKRLKWVKKIDRIEFKRNKKGVGIFTIMIEI